MKQVALVFALALAAPAFGDEPKQAPAEVTPSEAKAWLELFDKIVDAVVVNKDDCGKMAGTISALADANQPTITMARAARAKGKKLPATAQQHMLDGARRMIAALNKCGKDDKVNAAFKRLDFGKRNP